MEQNLKITFIGMDSSDGIKEAVQSMIQRLSTKVSPSMIQCNVHQNVANKGVSKDFKLDFNLSMDNATIRVETIGDDVYKMINESYETILRRHERYEGRKKHWEGDSQWDQIEGDSQDDETTQYIDGYTPVVSQRNSIKVGRPMHEAEAIEWMELLGYPHYIFKNLDSDGQLSMAYIRGVGGYGLLEIHGS